YWNKDITPTDTEIENKVSIYPNPFSTYLNISGIKGYAEIELIDLSGIVRFHKNINNYGQIPVDKLSPGIYLLKIKSSDGTVTKKLVKCAG
ncbi:MAG TPA: T9SS type A sorting domain-containing protein, partial [Bacteroidales bacterium]|nr:T9SS type A sorting domain-containing protein [Bacteroidales bacterium]